MTVKQMSSGGQLAVVVMMLFIVNSGTTIASTCEQKSLDNSQHWCIIVFTTVSEFDSGTEHAAYAQGYRQAKGVIVFAEVLQGVAQRCFTNQNEMGKTFALD